MQMNTRRNATDKAKRERLEGYGEGRKGREPDHTVAESAQDRRNDHGQDGGDKDCDQKKQRGDANAHVDPNIPAYFRQMAALRRQIMPGNEDESKILRYCISFTDNCNIMEDDVKIYEYMLPTNSITRSSLLYGTVPTPLLHLLIDYQNIRTTQIRQAYATRTTRR